MKRLSDKKSWLSVFLLTLVNNVVLFLRFRRIEIINRRNLPPGACLVIANHSSRWDSLLMQKLISRRANYMTSPNELVGFQGAVLPGIGSFPARASRDVVSFIAQQARKKEAIVIFPEGNVFFDGATHPFKNGTARIALSVNEMSVDMPVVPVAILYDNPSRKVRLLVGQPVHVQDHLDKFSVEPIATAKTLTTSLHRELCHLKVQLGNTADKDTLFTGSSARSWAPLLCNLHTDLG
jgi:1-acyl-sn-glycerol-3-phosphate acyltransferase